jgi:hypothetical protein
LRQKYLVVISKTHKDIHKKQKNGAKDTFFARQTNANFLCFLKEKEKEKERKL